MSLLTKMLLLIYMVSYYFNVITKLFLVQIVPVITSGVFINQQLYHYTSINGQIRKQDYAIQLIYMKLGIALR